MKAYSILTHDEWLLISSIFSSWRLPSFMLCLLKLSMPVVYYAPDM